ncbi:MAG: flagellar motor switch protein FliG, partial [Magnetovibrio sp.]|nr:flagellar motor switch protein FliG [Magnetovibrio sp.]
MSRVKDDFRALTGPQKAAIFMLSLGDEQSSALFELMDDEEIRELSQIMSGLGSVNSKVVERLFLEFADQLSSTGSLVGSYDSTERLL